MTTPKKLKICVIFGGRSGEHEVSLMSARSVLTTLNPEKYEITEVGITHDGIWLSGENVLEAMLSGETKHLRPVTILPDPTRKGLYSLPGTQGKGRFELITDFDVVFPVLHGTFGEDGTLQGLFEMAGVAYVSAGVAGSAVGMDKGIFKAVMRAKAIPVVDGIVVLRSEIETDMNAVLDRAELMAEYPLFVKPVNMGSSVGVSKCQNRSDLLEGLMEAARFDRRLLIERGVNAREIEISVLGNDKPQASVVGEIRPAAEFYSYNAKYHDDRSELLIPAPIPENLADEMRSVAVRAYKAIDCAGMARADFLLDRDSGEYYLNEVNTIPGFTQISMYPKLWNASGLPYPQLVDRLIELALERRAERDRTEWRYER
ncbi:MAG: D-alanine--D-alanine ligase family protein [Chloroflexota bacterium]|nr:D-alanine--D-alanine ligase family protein [Chloroflexota bacterium]